MTADEKGFLAALEGNPDDTTARAAYADWLEEHGRRYEASIQRGQAGISEIFYKLRRKSDGLFSKCNGSWDTKGKVWNNLAHLRAHIAQRSYKEKQILYWNDTPADDLEVVVMELRLVEGTALPVQYESALSSVSSRGFKVRIIEPLGAAEDR